MNVETGNIFTKFISPVNAHNCELLSGLICDDYEFCDSLENDFNRELSINEWTKTFVECSNYKIELHFDE